MISFNPRTMCKTLLASIGLLAAIAIPASAQEPTEFDRYAAYDETSTTRIDYAAFTEILRGSVFDVGRSDRIPGRGQDVIRTGTRISYENRSRYRYEANRLALHLFEAEHREVVAQYRAELESLPSRVNLARLSSNEQLAYWLNLHNIVVIDELARAYPIRRLRNWKIDGVPYADAEIINLDGHRISLNDIRFNIVGANWDDPRVIYGFFSGAIGGPTLQSRAFESSRVWSSLEANAREYVNALRGVESERLGFRVSPLYEEWRDIMFPAWPEDLRSHLGQFAEPNAQATIAVAEAPNFLIYDWAIADMTNGTPRCRGQNPAATQSNPCTTPPPHVAQLVNTIIERRLEFMRQGRLGSVTITDVDTPDPDEDDGRSSRRISPEGEAQGNEES